MLKIKDDKWEEFQTKSEQFGFQLNKYGNAFVIKFQDEKEFPNDFVLLQVLSPNKRIIIETSNARYSGVEICGLELDTIYDLILNGYIEKIKK